MGCQKKIAQKSMRIIYFRLKEIMRQLSTLQKPSSPVMNLAKRSVKSWRMNKKIGEASCEARYFITSVDDVSKASVALRLAGVLKTIFIGFWMLCLMKIFQPCAKTILLRILTYSESMPLMFSSRLISRNTQKRKILQFPTSNICAINEKIAWKELLIIYNAEALAPPSRKSIFGKLLLSLNEL